MVICPRRSKIGEGTMDGALSVCSSITRNFSASAGLFWMKLGVMTDFDTGVWQYQPDRPTTVQLPILIKPLKNLWGMIYFYNDSQYAQNETDWQTTPQPTGQKVPRRQSAMSQTPHFTHTKWVIIKHIHSLLYNLQKKKLKQLHSRTLGSLLTSLAAVFVPLGVTCVFQLWQYYKQKPKMSAWAKYMDNLTSENEYNLTVLTNYFDRKV